MSAPLYVEQLACLLYICYKPGKSRYLGLVVYIQTIHGRPVFAVTVIYRLSVTPQVMPGEPPEHHPNRPSLKVSRTQSVSDPIFSL